MYRLVLLFVFTCSLFAGTYLSKDAIDKKVQSAYYGFVATTRSAGGQYTQASAIAHAQSIVRDLKQRAKSDPNRQYMLFQIAGLEAQIALEQEEVSWKQEYARVASINTLVPVFNKELYKDQPSFAQLHSLYERMIGIDIGKSNQLVEKINQKNKAVTTLLRHDMREAFRQGDYKAVEALYTYAIKNKKYMNIGEREYGIWSKKIQAKQMANYLKKSLAQRIVEVRLLVKGNDIAGARRYIEVLRMESDQAAPHLTKNYVLTLQKKWETLEQDVNNQEMKMVSWAISLINKGEVEKATLYLEDEMIPAGVSLEKRAQVSRILLVEGAGPRKASREVNSHVSSITTSTGGMSSEKLRQDMVQRAKRLKKEFDRVAQATQNHYEQEHRSELKSQKKKMVKFSSEQQKADAYLTKVAVLFEQDKSSKAVKKFMKKHDYLLEYASPYTYYDIKLLVNAERGVDGRKDPDLRYLEELFSRSLPEKKQEAALKHTMEIYTLLEKNDIDGAYGKFLAQERLIEEYGYREAYVTLKRTVVKAYHKEEEL